MKVLLKITMLVAAVMSVNAAPTVKAADADITTRAYSSQTDIEAHYFKGCVPGTEKVTALEGGATEYTCKTLPDRKSNNKENGKHTFGTDLWLRTSSGTISIGYGGTGVSSTSPVYGFTYGGHIDSAWGTSRAVTYPEKRSIQDVDKAGRLCTGDGHFCFDVINGVCEFSFANKVWPRSCNLLKVIEFHADP